MIKGNLGRKPICWLLIELRSERSLGLKPGLMVISHSQKELPKTPDLPKRLIVFLENAIVHNMEIQITKDLNLLINCFEEKKDENHSVEFKSQYRIVALIANILTYFFPCCGKGYTLVKIKDVSVYISLADLRNTIGWNKTDSSTDINALIKVALSYFRPASQEPAKALAKKFLALKEKAPSSSGFTVHFTPSNSDPFHLEIRPIGTIGNQIVIPQDSGEGFKKTFESSQSALCQELHGKIKHCGMFPVFSHSQNLLLVPETKNQKKWAHLFCLDQSQLEMVFQATLETIQFIQEKDPSYQPRIAWHVGVDGYQTVGLLHTRIEGLPPDIRTQ